MIWRYEPAVDRGTPRDSTYKPITLPRIEDYEPDEGLLADVFFAMKKPPDE